MKIVPRGKTSAFDNNALKSNIHLTIFIQIHINNLSKKSIHTNTDCGSLHPSLAQTKKHFLYITDTIFHMKAVEIIELPKFFFSVEMPYTWFKRLRHIKGDPPSGCGVKSKTLTPQLLWSKILKYSVPKPVFHRKWGKLLSNSHFAHIPHPVRAEKGK